MPLNTSKMNAERGTMRLVALSFGVAARLVLSSDSHASYESFLIVDVRCPCSRDAQGSIKLGNGNWLRVQAI